MSLTGVLRPPPLTLGLAFVVSGNASLSSWPLTFGLTVLEGGSPRVLGEKPSSTGEAAGTPRLGLVCAHRAGLAGLETIH